jgi:alkylated DNA repair dioxygenase AlkB
MRLSLFKEQPLKLEWEDGWIFYDPFFLEDEVSDYYLANLTHIVPWQQQQVKIFGKWVDQPRLTALYGDTGLSYTYSGLCLEAIPWTPPLAELREAIEDSCDAHFNSALLNHYRDGQDSMGWHSDDEGSLGENPFIASVSLGAERTFMLRHRHDRFKKRSLKLKHGSLLLMGGALQHYWQHQLPKTKKPVSPRINLTFRKLIL